MALPAATRRAGLIANRNRSFHVPTVDPLQVGRIAMGTYAEIPDPIEWVVSDKYLDRPNLYPRQATFLKIIFLRDDMFTDFDHDVIGDWEKTFLSTGYEGINPGIYDRIKINKTCPCGHLRDVHKEILGSHRGSCKEDGCECKRYDGRKWFRETQSVWGRRGSKGYVGGLAGSYVLWHYMHSPGGPQHYYGIDRDKRLTGIVFAGKKEQARDNQWRDLVNAIVGGPCFSRYISRPQTERLTIECPNDWLRHKRMQRLGVQTEDDIASFEIVPAPSTTMAARGPTSFMQFYDEQAHVINSTSNADAESVYNSATPALDQFKKDGFIYTPSSPWTRQGQFFANWELAIEMEEDGTPSYPERLMLQLPSWGPYEDWDEADRIPLRPPTKTIDIKPVEVKKRRTVNGKRRTVTVTEDREIEVVRVGPTFRTLRGAIQAYDDDMRQLQRANPETFKVERLSHWANVLDAYLNPDMVERIFRPWNGRMLFVQRSGILAETYSAHGDPATSNKRFGWSVGHRVWVPKLDDDGKDTGEGMWHVVFDVIRCWEPADYPDHILDYEDGVMPDIWEDVRNFLPDVASFDQYNVPSTIGWLRKRVGKEQLPKQVQVHEVNRTRPVNWKHYEIFKSAINMGLVHAPMCLQERDDQDEWRINYASSEVENELKFLTEKNGAVNPPDSGPVQTKDIADTLCEVVVQLVGQQMASLLGMELDALGLRGGAPMGTDPGRHTRTDTNPVGERLGNLSAARRSGLANAPAARGGNRGMRRR